MAYILENDVSVLKVVRNHQVTESSCKLYLDESMAIERVPAHRFIQGAAFPVFHQMFHGELKEERGCFNSGHRKRCIC